MKPRKPPPLPVRDLFEKPSSAGFVDLRGEHRRRGRGSFWSLNRQRLAEIVRLIKHRHGGGACDTDDGDIYLQHAIPCFLSLASGHKAQPFYEAAMGFCQTFLPILAMGDGPAMIEAARQKPDSREWRHLKADPLGKALRVNSEERSFLDLRTIGAFDKSAAERAQERKAKDAKYQAEKRKEAGATPRSQSKTAQAEALGVSLSTFKRRLKAEALGAAAKAPDPISSAIVRSTYSPSTESVHPIVHAVEGPARQASPNRSVGAGGHSPRGKAKPVPASRPVLLPLPAGERPESAGDLLDAWEPLGSVVARIVAPLTNYQGGPFSNIQRLAAREWLRYENWDHGEFGRLIGVSRQQVTNALRENGRDNFGPEAASRLRALLPLAA